MYLMETKTEWHGDVESVFIEEDVDVTKICVSSGVEEAMWREGAAGKRTRIAVRLLSVRRNIDKGVMRGRETVGKSILKAQKREKK